MPQPQGCERAMGPRHAARRRPHRETDLTMEAGKSIQEFLEFVIAGLIESRDKASITHREEGNGRLIFDIRLEDEDVGRIVGKNGYVISSIRSLADAAAEKHNVRVRIRLHSVSEEGPVREVRE